ncbi:YceD family protein [Paenibacillus terrigena]|uniref:YceD family protein n=1 Tax=Paenibacillus terrigena TaxID=369333 RepID=UPI00036F10C4|nr:DUF177 domain-containing protein [Paenibacillus terrigena]
MNFNIRELMSKDTTITFDQSIDMNRIIEGRPDITYISPVKVELTVRPEMGGVIDVRGELNAELKLHCSRCLTPFAKSYVIPFHERFKLADSPEEAEADEDFEFVSEERVDLTPYMEAEMYMNLPYAPLCDEDCQGLCPTCGNNRNDKPCGCSNEKIDPRLAALQDFFKKD